MPLSIREQALSALFARFKAAPGFRLVERNWTGQPGGGDFPALVQFDGGEEVDEEATCNYQLSSDVIVGLWIDAGKTENIGPKISDCIALVKLAALGDQTLSGAARGVEYRGSPQPELDEESGGTPFVFIEMNFGVLFEHSETDPFTKA